MKAYIWFCFFYKNAVDFCFIFIVFFIFLLLFFWLHFVTRPFPGMFPTLQYKPQSSRYWQWSITLLAQKEEALSTVPTNILNKVTEQQALTFHLPTQKLWHHILKIKSLIFKDFHNSQASLLRICPNHLMTLNKTFSITKMQKKIFRITNSKIVSMCNGT